MSESHPKRARAARQISLQVTDDVRRRIGAIIAASPIPPTESAVLRATIDAGLPALERATGVTHTPEAPQHAA